MKLLRPHILGTVATVAGLLLLGTLTILAAPRHPSSAAPSAPSARVNTPPAVKQAHVLAAGADTTPAATAMATDVPTVAPTVAPTATLAPQPTATDTPAPQPTATPVPPTPTPAPSWHVIGSYSGSTAGPIATFTNPGTQVRVDWTCQDTQSLPTWQIAVSVEGYAGTGEACQPGQLSGSFTFDRLPPGSLTVDVSGGCSGACPPIGPWTATVEVWY